MRQNSKSLLHRAASILVALCLAAGTLSTAALAEEVPGADQPPSTEPTAAPQPEETPALALTEDAASNYTIYPIPHSVVYGDKALTLPAQIAVTFGESVDAPTRSWLTATLQTLPGASVTEGAAGEGQLPVKAVLASELEAMGIEYTPATASLFEKHDGYLLRADDSGILLVGGDNDGLFCAVSTLRSVLEQTSGSLRTVTIEDYADVQYRGVVEGYYGIPWSNENIISYMEWGSRFKMNTFIYAPKDDPYHNSRWRDPYPQEELDKMKELIEAGVRTKVRFIYAIHPFMSNGINKENFDAEIKCITDKFQVMYDMGVRQFALLADDAVSETALQVKTINAITEWLHTKPGTYPLVFCPQAYFGMPGAAAFNPFRDGTTITIGGVQQAVPAVADEVEIMHTGGAIIGNVDDSVPQTFREVSGRYPYFWLNWPVNDYTDSTLFLGKAEMLKGTAPYLNGLVSNPMCEAQLSKIGLFQVADYAWNIAAFDADTSWKASFANVEPDAAAELAELAKHMSYPRDGVYHTTGLAWGESEELAPLIDALKAKVTAGEDATAEADALAAALENIFAASNGLMEKSQNEGLKSEYAPYKQSLEATLNAALSGLRTLKAYYAGDYDTAWQEYSGIASSIAASNAVTKPGLKPAGNVELEVKPGTKRLRPLASWLNTQVAEMMNEVLGFGGKSTPYFQFESLQATKSEAEKYLDNSDSTYMSLEGIGYEQKAGDYFGVDLGKVQRISAVRVLQGSGSADQNFFHYAVLESSADGKEWTTLADYSEGNGAPQLIEANAETAARYVRLRLTKKGFGSKPDFWLHVRDFRVTLDTGAVLLTNLKDTTGLSVVRAEGEASLKAEKVTLEKDQYIGLDLGAIQMVDALSVPASLPQGIRLQASTSGKSWKNISADETGVTARYLRLYNEGGQPAAVSGVLQVTMQIIRPAKVQCSDAYLSGTANNATTVDNPSQLLFSLEDLSEGTHTLTMLTHPHNGRDKISLDKFVVDGKDVNLTLKNTEGLTLSADTAGKAWANWSPKPGWLNQDEIYLVDSTGKLIYTFTGTSIQLYGAKGPDMADFTCYVDDGYAYDNSKDALYDGQNQTLATFHSNFVTVDLGQRTDVNTLRLAVGENLYVQQPELAPGSGTIQLSADGKKWTDVHAFDITDNTVGEKGFTVHEAPFFYLDVKLDQPQSARYVRIKLDKAKDFAFNELTVNGGDLLSKADWALSSSQPQTADNLLANLTDSDLSTGFRVSGEQEGYVQMLFSEMENVSQFTIVQDASNISHARVELLAQGDWYSFGTLDKSINQFDTSKVAQVEGVRVIYPAGTEIRLLEITSKTDPALSPAPLNPVRFVADGKVLLQVLAENGQTVTLPDAPEKEGRTFLGWFVGEDQFTAETPITGAVTAEAKYQSDTPQPTATPVPTAEPTAQPPAKPTAQPTAAPTAVPTAAPTEAPAPNPDASATPAPAATEAPAPVIPQTGDGAQLTLWCLLAGTSALLAVCIASKCRHSGIE